MKFSIVVCFATGALFSAWPALANESQSLPVTAQQRATAQQVAQQGVPEAELAPNAPDTYTVQSGDTLWAISGLYLQRPWRWPALWGMNLESVRNPHLIYPGQVLYLEKSNGFARLRTARSSDSGALPTVRLTPATRAENLPATALPTLPAHLIEPFLAEPLVVDQGALNDTPRLIATTDERVLMAQGDRVYARGSAAHALRRDAGAPYRFRVFRNAVPLKDPVSQEILGYEAQYLGAAELIREEQMGAHTASGTYSPATLEILRTKEEIRAGDRLLPEPNRSFQSYAPHAPAHEVEARIVSLYSSTALRYGASRQVAVINKGTHDGLQHGHVLALVSQGARIVDKTGARPEWVQLPNEENGAAMVFRAFDRVSYVLLMDARRGVQVGDRLVTPH